MTDLTERINDIALFNGNTVKPGESAIEAIRDSLRWLQMVIMEKCDVAPDFTTEITSTSSPQNYAEPNTKTATKVIASASPNVTVSFRYLYTWSGGNKTGIEFQYYDAAASPQWATVTGGTAVLTYDGNGNFTGATTS